MNAVLAALFLALPAFAAVPANVMAYHQQVNGNHCLYGKDYADYSIGAVASSYDLGQGWTMYLVPCGAGAYQTNFLAYVANPKTSQLSQLLFIHWMSDSGLYASASLTDATFEKGLIRSYGVGRSIGDCGEDASYRLTAENGWEVLVKTVSIRAKEKCDGKMNRWPLVFGK